MCFVFISVLILISQLQTLKNVTLKNLYLCINQCLILVFETFISIAKGRLKGSCIVDSFGSVCSELSCLTKAKTFNLSEQGMFMGEMQTSDTAFDL